MNIGGTMMKVLGIDAGGTKIRFGIIDQEGKILFENTIKTAYPLYETLKKKH